MDGKRRRGEGGREGRVQGNRRCQTGKHGAGLNCTVLTSEEVGAVSTYSSGNENDDGENLKVEEVMVTPCEKWAHSRESDTSIRWYKFPESGKSTA